MRVTTCHTMCRSMIRSIKGKAPAVTPDLVPPGRCTWNKKILLHLTRELLRSHGLSCMRPRVTNGGASVRDTACALLNHSTFCGTILPRHTLSVCLLKCRAPLLCKKSSPMGDTAEYPQPTRRMHKEDLLTAMSLQLTTSQECYPGPNACMQKKLHQDVPAADNVT